MTYTYSNCSNAIDIAECCTFFNFNTISNAHRAKYIDVDLQPQFAIFLANGQHTWSDGDEMQTMQDYVRNNYLQYLYNNQLTKCWVKDINKCAYL